MMEGERVKMEKEVLGKVSEVDCPISFGVELDGTATQVDGWIMPVLELERIAQGRNALLESQDFYSPEESDSSEPIHPAELRFVSVMLIHCAKMLIKNILVP